MDASHARRHLADLQQRIVFLRSLTPDSPSYKLWLGDVVELINAVWGPQSTQMAGMAQALRPQSPATSGRSVPEASELAYVRRLNALDALLSAYGSDLDQPAKSE